MDQQECMNLTTLKKHSLILVQELTSSSHLKWVGNLIPIPLTKILKWNSKNSKEFVSNGKRICSKCGEEKLLDANHFQKVKSFREGFSFYCNECNKPKPREE